MPKYINRSWRPVEDVLLYGVYSRSFKSGGVNLNGLPFRADGVTGELPGV